MFIHSVSHAVPTTYFSQEDCLHAFERASCFHQLGPTSQKLLRHVLGRDNGIEQRHLCLQKIEDAFEATPDTLHQRFEKNAPLLATQAASQALDKAKLLPSEMDALIISTCTGYLCPGLTSYVAENLKIPLDHVFLDLVGHGCGAAIPNMRQAQALIDSHQATRVLSVCVEVCSAAFYLDDDPGVLISNCLFGDAAAAAVSSSMPPKNQRTIETMAWCSQLKPHHRDALRFEQRGGRLRNILSPETPHLAAMSAKEDFQKTLQKNQLDSSSVTAFVTHAGGRRVVDAIIQSMNLAPADLTISRQLLARYGNTSSPFVLMALEEHLRQQSPSGYWWMNTFGAGFSSHGLMLKVE